MIKNYRLEQGRVVEAAEGAGPILLVTGLTASEKDDLISRFQIDEHNLASALDPSELPRMEQDSNHLVIIFKYPKSYSAEDNFVFRVNSVGLFLFKDRLIIIGPNDLPTFEGRAFTKIQNLQMLLLRILSTYIAHFISHLQVINQIADELERKLATSMENRSLLLMFTIEKSLVYYVNAISANSRVIARMRANARDGKAEGLTAEMLEYVDDLEIENAQCLEQAQVYANVFTGLMDARASVVSNNLNILMKRLTIITVVFMPLNVLAGIGGMSEFTMMTTGVPWPVAYGIFTFGLTVMGLITYLILRRVERKSFGR